MQAMPLVEMWHRPPALIEDQELVGAARRSAQLAEPGNRDEFPLTPLLRLHDSPKCNGSTPVLIIGLAKPARGASRFGVAIATERFPSLTSRKAVPTEREPYSTKEIRREASVAIDRPAWKAGVES